MSAGIARAEPCLETGTSPVEPRRVLLVDDDESVRRSLPPALESADLEVVTAAGLAEAIDVLRALRVDLVMTDLRLRGRADTDGLDLAGWVREHLPETHVIVITGLGGPEIRADALRRGAVDYVEKSIEIGELVRRVRRLTGTDRTGARS